MRCFHVVVHGRIEWPEEQLADEALFTPAGFYCQRYVLASGFEDAADKAFRLVRRMIARQTGWFDGSAARLTLEVSELKPAPMIKLLRPRRRRVRDFYDGNPSQPAS